MVMSNLTWHVFKAHGTYGTVVASAVTGEVISAEGEYSDIICLDLDEFRNTYPDDVTLETDILDVGLWTADGFYEPPCEDYRERIRECMAETYSEENNQ
jgi:hypothetical protein